MKQKSIFTANACVFALLSIMIISCSDQTKNQSEQAETQAEDTIISEPKINEFGYPEDSVEILEGRILRNDNLAVILGRYEVSYGVIHELAQISKEIFDVRRIRTGNNYKLIRNKNTLQAHSLVYFKNPVEFVVFNWNDTISVYSGEKDVHTATQLTSGIIFSSLYETLLSNEVSPALAVRLSEIFAWQIDFFRIQAGDSYKIFFEEKYVDDEYIGLGNVIGANFSHNGKEFLAIRFEDGEGKVDYYDQDGHSVRKAFLKAPLQYSRISSGYSTRRFHPVLKEYRAHLGVDYAAPTGTPIMAVGEGTVEVAGFTRGNGNYVRIRHNSVYSTAYLHMSRFAKGIRSGVRVNQGDVIGYVGSTGLATGPHLCFRFYKNGQQVNPLTVEVPPSDPVNEEYLEEYLLKRDKILEKLNNISLPVADL